MSRPLPDFRQNRLAARRLPDWLRRSLAPGHEAARTDGLLKDLGLNTICESGRCPNRDECYSQRTATFMVLGDVCTRTCRFCSVSAGKPTEVDADEPRRVAEAAKRLGLKHVVVTSVNRDDLPDEGVGHFARVIEALRAVSPEIFIEILTPDFKRTQADAVRFLLAQAPPDIWNHNVETVPALYAKVRPQAVYESSLEIFREIKRLAPEMLTKSGLMLGLGEQRDEVLAALADLRRAGCEILTLGQYLRSSGSGIEVAEYVTPAVFAEIRERALEMGFSWVESGPYVRSSFHAKETFESLKAALESRKAVAASFEAKV